MTIFCAMIGYTLR